MTILSGGPLGPNRHWVISPKRQVYSTTPQNISVISSRRSLAAATRYFDFTLRCLPSWWRDDLLVHPPKDLGQVPDSRQRTGMSSFLAIVTSSSPAKTATKMCVKNQGCALLLLLLVGWKYLCLGQVETT